MKSGVDAACHGGTVPSPLISDYSQSFLLMVPGWRGLPDLEELQLSLKMKVHSSHLDSAKALP